MIEVWVHDGRAVAHVVEEALEQVPAPLGVDHLGMELHAVDGPLGVVEGGHRGVGAGGGGHEPVGHRGDGVAVAHPHLGGAGGQSANSGRVPVTVSGVRPYSPRPVRATSPPSCWVSSWAP